MKMIRKYRYFIAFFLSALSTLFAQDNLELLYTLDMGLPASGLNSDRVGANISVLGDINGDGYDDWGVAINGAEYGIPYGNRWYGSVHIYLGSAEHRGSETPADIIIYGDANKHFGEGVYKAGDVNGDGFDDILLRESMYDENGDYTGLGQALLFGGNPFDTEMDVLFTQLDTHAGSANFSSTAGDVNNDGFDDILVSIPTYQGSADTGHVYLYYGGNTMDNVPDVIFSGTVRPPGFNGGALNFGGATGAGDVNGDGFDDILISTSISANLYLGAVHMDKTADAIYNDFKDTTPRTGPSVTAIGDVNNDGYDEFIYATSTAFLCFGNEYVNDVPDIIIPRWTENGDRITVAPAGDINNDGYDDVLLGANTLSTAELGQAGILLGSAQMDSIIDITIDAPQTWTDFASSLAGNGDFNGDGYSDFLIGDLGNTTDFDEHNDAGSISMYYGGASVSQQADAIFSGTNEYEGFGSDVSDAGDVNNDGYPDIIVGASSHWDGYYAGRVYLFYGADTPQKKPDLIFKSTTTYNGNDVFFGRKVHNAGDVNGDGYSDILIEEKYKASLFLGGAPMDTIVDKIFNIQVSTDFNFSPVGDMNGDGCDDILYGKPFEGAGGTAVLFLGAKKLNNASEITLTGSAAGDDFGKVTAAAGDMNKDGYADFLIAVPGDDSYGTDLGTIHLYYGSSTFSPTQTIAYPAPADNPLTYDFGYHLSGGHDINGDGVNDVVVSKGLYSLTSNSNEGRIYIYYGGAASPDKSVDVILTGSAPKKYLGLKQLKLIHDINGDGFDDMLTTEGNYTSGGDDGIKPVILYGNTTIDDQSDVTLPYSPMNGDIEFYFDNNKQESIMLAGNPVNSAAGPSMGRVFVHSGTVTGLFENDPNNTIVNHFALEQNYPNPFNPTTVISYSVGAQNAAPLQVQLVIYNVLGQKVATLVSGKQAAGHHQVNWNAAKFPSGLYFYQLKTANLTQTRRMLLIK